MPVRPQPTCIACPACSWSMIYAPRSDALLSPPPSRCPRCNSGDLLVTPASAADVLADKLLNMLFGRS